MEQLKDLLEKSQYRQYSQREVLESYSHITLTEEEEIDGIIWAKQKKEKLIQEEELRAIETENRKLFSSGQWTFNITTDYMKYRMSNVFSGKFVIDEINETLFTALCYYFSNDKNYFSITEQLGIKNPSLTKGIMLAGNFGTGKTWMMKLFSKNQRQVFHIRTAKEIANDYQGNGTESIDYVNKHKNPVNDKDSFFQPYAGLCIDDIGTEDIKTTSGIRIFIVYCGGR